MADVLALPGAVVEGRIAGRYLLSSSASGGTLIIQGVSKKGIRAVKGVLPMEVATYLQNKKRKELAQLESRYGFYISLEGDPSIPLGGGNLDFEKEDVH